MATLDTKQFIISVRELAKKEEEVDPASRQQIVKLIIVITERILDKENRKNVASAILGRQVDTFNNLSSFITNVLIDEIEKRRNGTDILREIEMVVVDNPDEPARSIFSNAGSGGALSDMLNADERKEFDRSSRGVNYPWPSAEIAEQGEDL